jgi:RNA polymerase sigma-70 factor, ECF subfamily
VESFQVTEVISLEVVPAKLLSKGNPEPLDALFDEHFDAIFRYLSRRLDNPDDAKDAAAETFVAAVAKRCPRGVAPRCWLYGIARRKLADALRRRRRHENLDPNIADPSNIENTVALRRSIEALPHHQREAFLLQALEDLSVEEISQVMRRSRTSVKALLQRARETLRNDYDDFLTVQDARK